MTSTDRATWESLSSVTLGITLFLSFRSCLISLSFFFLFSWLHGHFFPHTVSMINHWSCCMLVVCQQWNPQVVLKQALSAARIICRSAQSWVILIKSLPSACEMLQVNKLMKDTCRFDRDWLFLPWKKKTKLFGNKLLILVRQVFHNIRGRDTQL